jgi:hypothetical protein
MTTWLSQRQTAQGQQFTEAALHWNMQLRFPVLKKEIKENDEELVKFPDIFGKETSWKTFKKVSKKYLGAKEGVNGIPFQYIICKNDEPGLAGIVFATDNETCVVINPLEGEAFESAKGKVWSVLMDLMYKRLTYAYIIHLERMIYGMAIIMALCAHYEAALAISHTKAKAYKMLNNAS